MRSALLGLLCAAMIPVAGQGIKPRPAFRWIGLGFGLNGQQILGQGRCFVPLPYGCAGGPGATPFDHLGTYVSGDAISTMTLTITSREVPEPLGILTP